MNEKLNCVHLFLNNTCYRWFVFRWYIVKINKYCKTVCENILKIDSFAPKRASKCSGWQKYKIISSHMISNNACYQRFVFC